MLKALESTAEERLIALFRILRLKTRYIPDRVLLYCIRQLNTKRAYSIKRTSSSAKFLNMATEEFVAAPNRKVLSHITVLYGDISPGYFQETRLGKTLVAGSIHGKGPIVALKRSVYTSSHGVSKTYSLLIFDCEA